MSSWSSSVQASTYGDSFADVYDRWYPDISDTDATVAQLLDLETHGLIIELGIGTGRLALRLATAGRSVRGIDSSVAMVERLREKPGGAEIDVIIGDMACEPLGSPGEASLVFIAFNTFFNLITAEAQRSCLANVVEVLKPGGRFALEAFVPPPIDQLERTGLSTKTVDLDRVVLTATETNAEAQTISGQHIEISDTGIRLRPWMLRFAAPDEIDAMAEAAGLSLETRHSSWSGDRFEPTSETHVSVYRK
ncbi:MAG: class I SAM-dependent methyltransferase [Acidimicrobiales bacterium]